MQKWLDFTLLKVSVETDNALISHLKKDLPHLGLSIQSLQAELTNLKNTTQFFYTETQKLVTSQRKSNIYYIIFHIALTVILALIWFLLTPLWFKSPVKRGPDSINSCSDFSKLNLYIKK